MDSPVNTSLKFFKILLDDTAPKQQLPPVFVKKLFLGGGFSSNSVVLETHCGKKWRVKVENDGDGYYLGKGWLDFVRDTNTKTGDFLAFSLMDNSTFKVDIFGPSGSEKNLSYAIPTRDCDRGKTAIQTEDVEEEEEDEAYDDDDGRETLNDETGNHCVMRVIKKSHRYTMRFPKDFVSESEVGIEGDTVLRNKDGKEWNVQLKRKDGGMFLQCGWVNFYKANKLKEGDVCSFQYFPGDGVGHSFIKFDLVMKPSRGRLLFLANQINP